MTPFLIKVNIPVNRSDVICLIIVLILCAFAVRVIMGFFTKPTVKNKDLAGGDRINESHSEKMRLTNPTDRRHDL